MPWPFTRQQGEYGRALVLDARALRRRRRVLGDGHPLTLTNVTAAAADLSGLGEHQSFGRSSDWPRDARTSAGALCRQQPSLASRRSRVQ
jgi:hypothetical protein